MNESAIIDRAHTLLRQSTILQIRAQALLAIGTSRAESLKLIEEIEKVAIELDVIRSLCRDAGEV